MQIWWCVDENSYFQWVRYARKLIDTILVDTTKQHKNDNCLDRGNIICGFWTVLEELRFIFHYKVSRKFSAELFAIFGYMVMVYGRGHWGPNCLVKRRWINALEIISIKNICLIWWYLLLSQISFGQHVGNHLWFYDHP